MGAPSSSATCDSQGRRPMFRSVTGWRCGEGNAAVSPASALGRHWGSGEDCGGPAAVSLAQDRIRAQCYLGVPIFQEILIHI